MPKREKKYYGWRMLKKVNKYVKKEGRKIGMNERTNKARHDGRKFAMIKRSGEEGLKGFFF